jgi:hypothetical protein
LFVGFEQGNQVGLFQQSIRNTSGHRGRAT